MIRNAIAAVLTVLAAGCATPADDIAGAGTRTENVGIMSTPNLIVTGATHTTVSCSLGQCTVRFNVTIKNTGTATAVYPYAGAEWGTTALPVSNCSSVGSSTWRAIGSNGGSLAPGASTTILVYGPGYVGPKVSQGSTLWVLFGADPCNAHAESSETDNTVNKSFVI